MKSILFAGLATLFFTACGGGSSEDSTPTPAPITVNVLGTWDYAIFTENSICDGLLIQGIEIIESLNGDTTKIGDIIIDGAGFDVDINQNCFVTTIHETSSKVSGFPSTGTADDWLALGEALNAGDNTIDHLSVDSFNEFKIQTSTHFTNGIIITSILTR